MTWDEVVAMAVDHPGVEPGSSYGTPSLRVRKKFMARLREDDVMVLMPVDDIEQRMLMDTQPEIYFKTAHYMGHPSILIRVSRVDPADMRELLERSWSRLAGPRLLAERAARG